MSTYHPEEKCFGEEEILVSKTDLEGRIIYGNARFLEMCEYRFDELYLKPHSIIRHPDMPACVFKMLWDTIAAGKEMNAYVKNKTKKGDYYWAFANVTPSVDAGEKIIGYHSTRRCPSREAIAILDPMYKELRALEQREGMEASLRKMHRFLKEKGVEYAQFILSL